MHKFHAQNLQQSCSTLYNFVPRFTLIYLHLELGTVPQQAHQFQYRRIM